ncbi:MAG: hypothetical protein HYY37_02000 [Candidatus Aenigmarchaeota archaeon]|nr:hypothetical protein [Candidatus Aenigmarchaeota archaeon]
MDTAALAAARQELREYFGSSLRSCRGSNMEYAMTFKEGVDRLIEKGYNITIGDYARIFREEAWK